MICIIEIVFTRLQETTTELKNKTWAALISFLATRVYIEV